jgi:aminopeptidase-like protein
MLARWLAEKPRRYSYRFLFMPGTIGAIAWLACNEERLGQIRHGLVLALVGDPGKSTYKKSRRGDAEIDRAMLNVLARSGQDYAVRPFEPFGYDERQFCSPGIDLPMGCLMRTPPDLLPQYHTSADNLDLVAPSALAESLAACMAVCEVLENDRRYVSRNPRCEPQLGKRGLYRLIGGPAGAGVEQMALLWVLNLADGQHSLVDIAERSGSSFASIAHAAAVLHEHDLLSEAEE